MFDAVAGIKFGYILCGIIWALAVGFAIGNYACSIVHRLPRGRLILDKKPYCGTCGTLLQVKDLFPVVSALLLRHRCRYCGTPYPVSHTWTEILVGLLFVLTFFKYNFSEQMILIVLIGVFLIILAAIHANESIIMGKILVCVMISGMLYRTLQDKTIYNFFEGGFYGLIIGALIWRKEIKQVGHIFTLPKTAELVVIGGICVGLNELPTFLILFSIFSLIDKSIRKISHSPKPALITVPFGLATMIPVIYPGLFPLALS